MLRSDDANRTDRCFAHSGAKSPRRSDTGPAIWHQTTRASAREQGIRRDRRAHKRKTEAKVKRCWKESDFGRRKEALGRDQGWQSAVSVFKRERKKSCERITPHSTSFQFSPNLVPSEKIIEAGTQTAFISRNSAA